MSDFNRITNVEADIDELRDQIIRMDNRVTVAEGLLENLNNHVKEMMGEEDE